MALRLLALQTPRHATDGREPTDTAAIERPVPRRKPAPPRRLPSA
jgi:hypothetical protein